MNPNLDKLQPYPFEKLAALKAGVRAPAEHSAISMSIGEPQHAAPQFVLDVIHEKLRTVENYPLTKGLEELRLAIRQWLTRRFGLESTALDENEHIIPVSGTREALFAFAQATISASDQPIVVAPNPFYQIYEGAALLAGADIHFLNTTEENDYAPELSKIDPKIWKQCQLIYVCTPGNPTGKVLSFEYLSELLDLADKYGFIVASDECYSELYFDESKPPMGLLEVAAKTGRDHFERCIVFHSLSKRSNLPGLRSGFVAGDRRIIQQFLKYRTYHGSALPLFNQYASIAAWNDEAHVKANRELYKAKFEKVLEILQPVLDVSLPDAGFYLWPKTPISDEAFAKQLFATTNVTVLPGSYLSRIADGINPGENRVRIALVAELTQCIEAANRIKQFTENLK